MQAIQGIYDNGILKLESKAPASKSHVIVLFTEEEPQKKMSSDEALRIFYKYAGSVKGDVDLEQEKEEYFNEKHGSLN
jgi:glucokinase